MASVLGHDLNNLLAALHNNAFLLRGAVAGEDAEALRGMESALDAASIIPCVLAVLQVAPPHDAPPVTVGDATLMVKALLERLGRTDITCVVRVADDARDTPVSGTLVEQGFMTLAALAAELLPHGAELAIAGAAVAAGSRVRLTLGLSAAEIPPRLSLGSEAHRTPECLPLTQLVRWFVGIHGGELVVTTPREGGVHFELLMTEVPN